MTAAGVAPDGLTYNVSTSADGYGWAMVVESVNSGLIDVASVK